MTVLRVIPLVVALQCCLVLVSAQVDIVFVDTYKEVVEGQQFDLRIKRLGPITKVINVIVEVSVTKWSLTFNLRIYRILLIKYFAYSQI